MEAGLLSAHHPVLGLPDLSVVLAESRLTNFIYLITITSIIYYCFLFCRLILQLASSQLFWQCSQIMIVISDVKRESI